MHVLDNEAPESHRDAIEASNSMHQLVPPNNHRHNASERAIMACKENFIRILIRIDVKFTMSMWDHLIEQTNIAVNLLRQSKVQPHLSGWSHYNGVLDCNANPMGLAGRRALIYEPVKIELLGEHTLLKDAAPGQHCTTIITSRRSHLKLGLHVSWTL